MKKILVINTKYKIFGGEDSNIIEELNFLEKNYQVEYLEFDNSEKIKISDLFSVLTLSNTISNKILRKKITQFNPDYVYVHNTWFKANLGIFKILKDSGIKTFIKLHNFRFACTNTFFSSKHFINNRFCPRCGQRKKKFKFLNMYFQNSIFKSLFVAWYGINYFSILKNSNFKLIVLNKFYKDYLLKMGIPDSKIFINYNPVSINLENNYNPNSDYVVYAGGINLEKGVPELLDSWLDSKTDLNLYLFGTGEILKELQQKYTNKNIIFFGFVRNSEVINYIKNSRAVVTATKMYEGQPRLLTEASMLKIPSIYPSYGGMDEYFPEDYQFSFTQFNYQDLIKKISLLDSTNTLQHESNKLYEYIEYLLDPKDLQKCFQEIID